MLGADTGSGTVRATKHDRSAHLAAGHVERLGSGVDDLVDRLHGEVEGHELDDRLQAGHRGTDADAGEAVLGDRGVDDAASAEFLQQTLGDLVGALVFGHFLAHDEDVVVGAHFLGHGVAQRFANGHGDHFGAGGDFRIVRNLGLGLGGNRSSGGGGRFSGLRRLSGGRCGSGRCSRDVGCGFAVLQENRDLGVHLDTFGAGGNQKLADDAFVDGFDFHRRLVGFDFGDDVAGGDLVTFLLQPLGQRAFFHRRREGGHENIDWHGSTLPDYSRMSV